MRKHHGNKGRGRLDGDVAAAISPGPWGTLYACRGVPLFRVVPAHDETARAGGSELRAAIEETDPKKLN
jgi:hypothetical protein